MERKALTTLFFTLVLDMIGIGMLIPIIPIIFTDPTSPSFLLEGVAEKYWYFFAGLTIAIFGFVQFFAAPILGELSDMYGRKKLLFLGVTVLAFSQFVFGFGIVTNSLAIITALYSKECQRQGRHLLLAVFYFYFVLVKE